MKVITTSSALPVPVGTIMDVGEQIPVAWRGLCVPYLEGQAKKPARGTDVLTGEVRDAEPLDSGGDGKKPAASWRKPKPG